MKRFFLALALALVPSISIAQALTIPVYEETPGGVRKWVGTTQPLPVTDAGAGAGGASTTAAISSLAAQQATESANLLAAQASTTLYLGALATPAITIVSATTPAASHVPTAKRLYVVLHNQSGAETVYVNPAGTAIAGAHIPIYPGSTILRPWGPTVTISYVASTASSLLIEEAVLP